jgi:S1-C subfamily serine protease
LRIEAKDLPYVKFDNSDNLRIGEWVIAVGNPFNLTSTVTAGIVSAKGRNINIVNSQFPIESFIQTDAAINPGNSGGALVNLKGQLVGINTAIYSQTGSYAGYGFAVPANVVSKVVKDMVEFGEVQRPFLNADIQDIDQKLADKLKEENLKGVFVKDIGSGGAADKAGLEVGDIILKIDGVEVNSKATFEERISYYRPGDKVKLTVNRKSELRDHVVSLTNREGTSEMLRKQSVTSVSLGADFELLSKVEREKMNVDGGVKVSNIRNGLIRNMNLPEGFVITAINKVKLTDAEDAIRILESNKGTVVIEGVHPNGTRAYYSFYVR